MSAWMPISTAPKDRPIDLWTDYGEHIPRVNWSELTGHWHSKGLGAFFRGTHWREPDKGPCQEEGEVRWMVAVEGQLGAGTFNSWEAANQFMANNLNANLIASVVRVRIVREGE